jgi:hypothetical protein
MAKAAAAGKPGAKDNASNGTAAAGGMPSKFRRISTVSDAPWAAQEKGNTVQGKLLGRHIMNSEPVRYYYQVELTAPCKARQGSGDDAESIDAEKGDVVNLNENYKIKVLTETVVPEMLAGAEYEVFVEFKEKIKLKNGRQMWDAEVGSFQLKPPTRAVVPLPKDSVSTAEGETDATPF